MVENTLEERRAFLETRIAWNQKNIDSLARDRRRMPFLLLLFLLTIPAGLRFGWVAVVLVIFGTVVTTIVGYYLTWGHQSEYQQKIDDLKQRMEELERDERADKMRRLTESP